VRIPTRSPVAHAALLAAIALGGCRAGAPHRAGTADAAASLRSVSSLTVLPDSAGQPRLRIVNHRYLVRERGSGRSDRAVFEETTEERCCVEAERTSFSTVTLARWPAPAGGDTAPAWRVTVTADEGAFTDDFYRATLNGCCDQTAALFFIDPAGGRVAFTHSREEGEGGDALPQIHHWASQSTRYVAFHDRYTEANPPESAADSTVVGVLQYGPASGATERLVLRRPRGDGVRYRLGRLALTTGTWTGRELELPTVPRDARPPAAFGRFSIRVELVSEEADSTWAVVVPVEDDQPRADRAKVPSGLELRAAARTR
jgi:hypothetical protein